MTIYEKKFEVIDLLKATKSKVGNASADELKNDLNAAISKLLASITASDGPCNPVAIDEVTAAVEANNEKLAEHNAQMDEVLAKPKEHTSAATSDGDNSTPTNTDKVLFLFTRICALKAEKQRIAETMGAKWLSDTIADEFNNTIYCLLEEIEALAGADAESI